MSEVLKRVEEKMRSRLNPHDWKPLPSDPKIPRWRNTAQWCRSTLVNEGLMESNSPHGIWEISEKGRAYLHNESPQPFGGTGA